MKVNLVSIETCDVSMETIKFNLNRQGHVHLLLELLKIVNQLINSS